MQSIFIYLFFSTDKSFILDHLSIVNTITKVWENKTGITFLISVYIKTNNWNTDTFLFPSVAVQSLSD